MGNPFSKTWGHSEEEKDDRKTVILRVDSRGRKMGKIKKSVKKNQNSLGLGLEKLELKDVKFYKNKIHMSP